MIPIKIPKSASSDELFEYYETNYISDFVAYMINSKYRKSVQLKNWIKEQVHSPTEELSALASKLKKNVDYDEQAILVLNWVAKNIRYVPDSTVWKMSEYWQTASETLQKKTGDCEDGGILIYVLCRLCGIPKNRLFIDAGDVDEPGTNTTVGHAWCTYKPIQYPTSFVFLDWCYYYVSRPVNDRNIFTIYDKKINEYNSGQRVKSKYKQIWFVFNEKIALRTLKPKWLL